MNNFTNIIDCLNTLKFNENELETIINIANTKLKENTNEYYKNEIYKLNNNKYKIINLFNNITFYDKSSDNFVSNNITFKYEYFNITLSHKISYCSEFGGVSIDNIINIIDTHQETCYNLFGINMISRFNNILNLNMKEDNIKEMLTLIFKAYQPDKNIKW